MFPFFTGTIKVDADTPERFVWYRQIAMSIHDYYMEHDELPNKFSEIPILEELLRDPKTSYKIKNEINSLSIVPGAPFIKIDSQEKALSKYHASRLYAISRIANYDFMVAGNSLRENNNGGRYAIMVNSDPMSVWCTWIEEKHAQKILEKIDNFDPSNQPLIYQNIETEKSAIERQIKETDLISVERRERALGEYPEVPEKSDVHEDSARKNEIVAKWIWATVLAIPIFGVIVLFLLKRGPGSRP
ncbi:MAG TPA: hypothetical protein VLO11_03075 [Luteolibacter sp.]|nr:hypothetical protein [Luteolibacter sp.]